ncbi:nickel-dependent hydrogenase large subunit [Escherichia coli]
MLSAPDRHQGRQDRELSGGGAIDLELGPRNFNDEPGPYEQALVVPRWRIPPNRWRWWRTIHSFDPCMSCAVHVVDTQNGETTQVKAL